MKSLVLLIVFLWPVGEIYAASLPVREVVRRFLQTSPLLEAIHKEQLAAEAVEQESSRRFFPSISLNTGVTDQKTPSVLQGGFDFAHKKIYSTTLDFEQPLYLGGRIWRGWELRELSAELAKWKTIEVEQKALLEILGVALQLNVSQNMEKIFKQSESTQAEFLRITQKRYRRGASKSYEVAQAEADLLSYRGRLQEVRLQKESFSQKLQTQLDLNDSAEPL